MTGYVTYRRALREGHEATARLLAEREALSLAGDLPVPPAYLEEIGRSIEQMVKDAHREHGVPEDMDALMYVYASGAFLERLEEILSSPLYPKPANDPGREH